VPFLGKSVVPTSTSVTSTTDSVPQPDPLLLVDNSPVKPEPELFSYLQRKLPNLPLSYLHEVKNKNYGLNKTCATYPAIYDLHISNLYWQETTTSNGTFYLYGAYLDVRKTNRLGKIFIRIIIYFPALASIPLNPILFSTKLIYLHIVPYLKP